jgi:hypothetical protein
VVVLVVGVGENDKFFNIVYYGVRSKGQKEVR